jgi:Leucine-rich repeat (LRR) protein
LTNLHTLSLCTNNLITLPQELGSCTGLQKLYLSVSQIQLVSPSFNKNIIITI